MRHRLRFSLLVTMLAALAAPMLVRSAPAAAYDYVVNGGFEDGTAGWTANGGSLTDVDASVVSPAGGATSGRLTLEGGTFVVRQSNRQGAPGGTLLVSARLRASSPMQGYLRITAIDPIESHAQVDWHADASGWIEVSRQIAITGASTLTVTVAGDGASGESLYLDDIRIDGAPAATLTPSWTPTPPPTQTPTPTTTGTKTHTPTKTLTPTRTISVTTVPSATPTPALAVAAVTVAGLHNGGFEELSADGLPAYWQKYGGILSSGDQAHSGGRAALLESATESTKWVYQTVEVDGGASYVFSGWVLHGVPGVASAFLRVSWYETADGTGTAMSSDDSPALDSPSPGYRFVSTGRITAPHGARSAKVRVMLAPVSALPAHLIVDDVTWDLAAPLSAAGPGNAAEAGSSTASQAAPGSSQMAPRGGTARPSLLVAGPSTTTLRINEVLYDSSADGPDSDHEWVELFNAGPAPIDLAGWSLRDGSAIDMLPEHLLASGGYVVIAASNRFLTEYRPFDGALVVLGGRIGNGLGNDGDSLALVDPSGAVFDAVSWGDDAAAFDPPVADVPAGHSIERALPGADSNTAADWVDNDRPSPGVPLSEPLRSTNERGLVDRNVEVLAGDRARSWVPWAVSAAAISALAFTVAVHAAPLLRRRLTRAP